MNKWYNYKDFVTVPHPRKDFKPGTFANILRQAGLK
ncbi:type II toxin-antitoxin system HicA family toxin [Peptoniphilus sp.]